MKKLKTRISILVATTIALSVLVGCTKKAEIKPVEKAPSVITEEVKDKSSLGWNSQTYRSFKKTFDANSNKKDAYAVFDMDNTLMYNDAGETTFRYMVENLKFAKLSTEDFYKALSFNVPKNIVLDKDKPTITVDALMLDIKNDYEALMLKVNDKASSDTLAYKKLKEYDDFRVKMFYMYDRLCEVAGSKIGYVWVGQFFYGQTPLAIKDIAKEAINTNRYPSAIMDIKNEILSSTDVNNNIKSHIEVTIKRAIRPYPTMVEFVKNLKESKYNTYIVSASFQPIAEAVADSDEFKIPLENVYGLRMATDESGKYKLEYMKDYPIVYKEGKVELIKKYILPKHNNVKPVFTSGDSTGDYAMMTDEAVKPQTVIVIDRVPSDVKLKELITKGLNPAQNEVITVSIDENKAVFTGGDVTVKLAK